MGNWPLLFWVLFGVLFWVLFGVLFLHPFIILGPGLSAWADETGPITLVEVNNKCLHTSEKSEVSANIYTY